MASSTTPRRAQCARHPARLAVAVLVAVFALVAAACTSEGSTASSSSTTSSSTTTTTALDPGPGPTSLEGVGIGLEAVVDPGDMAFPSAMTARPGRNQLWIAEREGGVRVLTVNTEWDKTAGRTKHTGYSLLPGTALDLSGLTTTDGERGLLGIAFSSDGRTLYVDHTKPSGDIVVAAYTVTDRSQYSGGNGPTPNVSSVVDIDPASRVELLTVPHRDQSNHNGGQLVLGPDGYLYIGVGDGGGSGDPNGNGQDTDTLLGSILRIDPAGAVPFVNTYAIPPDNPFAESGGRPEIYLYGVRNPWRFSFDTANDDLWVADVGQNAVEEIDWLPGFYGSGLGANLGWNFFEGDTRFNTDGTPPEGTVDPLFTYTHDDGRCSITGGYVYRGSAVPDLDGVYVYGDYCTGEIRGLLARNGIVLDDAALGASTPANTLVSFGVDDDGELYVLRADGGISRVVAG